MKPLDQVVRDCIAPVLKESGFKKTGRLFTLERPDGNRAHVNVHPYRLGMNDAEFFLDLHIQPKIWRDLQERIGQQTYVGMWSSRLGPPNGKVGGSNELWRIDLGDKAAASELSQTIKSALPNFLQYLDVQVLADYVRNPADVLGKVRGEPERALALLLATQGPSAELDATLASLEQQVALQNGLTGVELAAFLRTWAFEHPATASAG